MLAKPHLRRYVRKIQLYRTVKLSAYFQHPSAEALADRDSALLKSAIQGAGIFDEQMVNNCLSAIVMRIWNKGSLLYENQTLAAETHATLFMSLSPNLEFLQLDMAGAESPIEIFLRHTNQEPSRFLPSLRSIHIYHHPRHGTEYYGDYDFLSVLEYFHLYPSMESVRINRMRPATGGRKTLPPGKSNISKVYISNSYARSSYLAAIILHSKCLEEFIYTVEKRKEIALFQYYGSEIRAYRLNEATNPIYPGTLRNTLLQHKPTLRKLNLDCNTDIKVATSSDEAELGEANYDDTEDPSLSENAYYPHGFDIGPLDEFTALRKLSIGTELLLGKHEYHNRTLGLDKEMRQSPPFRLCKALPPNLKYLCIKGYEPGQCVYCTRQISDLIDRKAGRLPFPRRIDGVDELVPGDRHATWKQGGLPIQGESCSWNGASLSDYEGWKDFD
ncbi:hypothetical protein AJ80_07487 [Polytolypa hystricis UAMH7299]|uniref:Uncharacterized protein n=1 Tax=Polytolypa hystricis (strain UAMH7299) TaxID=1447883 RepID=A0A2B7XP52_POLH7|nr:hypothetical protein AJ80_07487 [Polytolypa hystricis UAMH7299]